MRLQHLIEHTTTRFHARALIAKFRKFAQLSCVRNRERRCDSRAVFKFARNQRDFILRHSAAHHELQPLRTRSIKFLREGFKSCFETKEFFVQRTLTRFDTRKPRRKLTAFTIETHRCLVGARECLICKQCRVLCCTPSLSRSVRVCICDLRRVGCFGELFLRERDGICEPRALRSRGCKSRAFFEQCCA